MIQVDALFFDLDGTLIDSKTDLALSVQETQRRFGSRLSSLDEVGAFVGDGVVKLIQRALPTLSDEALAGAVEAFKDHYREHCLDHTRLYPGARDMLERYRSKKLAVLTNKPERISRRILSGLGLAE